jgi:hypothetical protein
MSPLEKRRKLIKNIATVGIGGSLGALTVGDQYKSGTRGMSDKERSRRKLKMRVLGGIQGAALGGVLRPHRDYSNWNKIYMDELGIPGIFGAASFLKHDDTWARKNIKRKPDESKVDYEAHLLEKRLWKGLGGMGVLSTIAQLRHSAASERAKFRKAWEDKAEDAFGRYQRAEDTFEEAERASHNRYGNSEERNKRWSEWQDTFNRRQRGGASHGTDWDKHYEDIFGAGSGAGRGTGGSTGGSAGWKPFSWDSKPTEALAVIKKHGGGKLDLKSPDVKKNFKKLKRELVMKHHPDRGGDEETMKKINVSLAEINDYLEKNAHLTFCSTLMQKRAERGQVSDRRLRQRFRAISNNLERHGAVTNPLNEHLKRIAFSKKSLTGAQIKRLGFEKVTIAIPEKGQSSFMTYRHPMSNHHIHDHGDTWVMHKDKHSALPMIMRRIKLREQGKLKSTKTPTGRASKVNTPSTRNKGRLAGMEHLFGEGVRGLAGYTKSVLMGGEDMLIKTQGGMRSAGRRSMNRLQELQESPETLVEDIN